MTSDSRDFILSNLRAALAANPVRVPEARPRAASPPWSGSAQDLARAFEAAGASARVCASPQDLARELVRVAREHGAARAAVWGHPAIAGLGLDRELEQAGVAVVRASGGPDRARACRPSWPGENLSCREAAGADLGLCVADAVLAASGTLVLRSGPGRPRSHALLPPVFVALASPATALADLDGLMPVLDGWIGEKALSGVFCVTGPSATGDIEFVLVRGAHGPPTVVVLVADFPL